MRGLNLLQHRLQSILELAAILGARDQRPHVERHDALVLQRLGDVAVHDALGNSLGDRGLAHARLADEAWVVFPAPREDLHDAPDLVVAADDGVHLALAHISGKVATVLVEGLELSLRIGVGDALRASHARESLHEPVGRHASRGDEGRGHLAIVLGEREDEVLDRDEVVLQRLRLVLGLAQDLHGATRKPGLRAGSADARELVEVRIESLLERRRVTSSLRQQGTKDAPVLREHGLHQMLGNELGVSTSAREVTCLAKRFLALGRHPVGSHSKLSCKVGA